MQEKLLITVPDKERGKGERKMKKQKSIGNKGFSLVELIIVIAIMAILVGVMAPQLLRYVERTRVSSDTQFADSVRTAVTTAMMDPAVIGANDTSTNSIASLSTATDLVTLMGTDNAFTQAIAETLGEDDPGDITQPWVTGNLKSTPAGAAAMTIMVQVVNSNNVVVTISGSNNNGNGEISVGQNNAPAPAGP